MYDLSRDVYVSVRQQKVPKEFGTFCLRLRRKLCHDVRDGPELHPPLLARALEFHICHAVEIAHIVKHEFSILQTDEAACSIAFIALLDQMLDAQSCQASGLDAVKGRGVAALLQMPEDGGTHIEYILAFLLEQGTDKVRRVDRIRIFVADDQSQSLAEMKPR